MSSEPIDIDEPEAEPHTEVAGIDIAMLTKATPANAKKNRRGGGGSLTYVTGGFVIRRLNRATRYRWDFTVIGETTVHLEWDTKDKAGNIIGHRAADILRVHGRLTIPGLGTRDDYGVQVLDGSAGEDSMKGAVTDCLKRCARLFGVALDLYGEDVERADDEFAPQAPERHETAPQGQTQRRQPQRPAQQRTAPPARASNGPVSGSAGVDPNATRYSERGEPMPSLSQLPNIQEIAIQKGTAIGDTDTWRQIATRVAVMGSGNPEASWPGKLVPKEIYEALIALPDMPG